MFKTLVSADILRRHLEDPDWVVVDCRFDLGDTAVGRRQYEAAHIPGALYAHLDEDLSGPPATDHGRHPLPTPAALTVLFSRLGIEAGKQVVAYDGHNGVYAARLWWMLRFMGHEATAVLDGGWAAWEAAGYAVRGGVESTRPALFAGAPRWEWLVQMAEVPQVELLVDSRGGARYRGEEEPIDPQPGRIPGAVHYFYQDNWTADGRYLPPQAIKQQMAGLLGGRPAETAVFYCGSGVSACVNLLALAHAGLGAGRLYVGSWSEWSSHPENPIASG